MKEKLQLWKQLTSQNSSDHPNTQIVEWLNLNIKIKRTFKQKQLYIYGPPNMGKTSLVHFLEKYLMIYRIPPDEDFYDDYEDGVYDLMVLDEFRGNKRVQWLNILLEGSFLPLRKKGSQYLKKDNLPIIILSNFSLEDSYQNVNRHQPERLESLKARLEIIEVSEFIEVREQSGEESRDREIGETNTGSKDRDDSSDEDTVRSPSEDLCSLSDGDG